MKDNTKKILACLVAGTVVIGVKYKVEQIENEKRKKSNKIRRIQLRLQNKERKEKQGRYIKINSESNIIPSEKEKIEIKENEEKKGSNLEGINIQSANTASDNIKLAEIETDNIKAAEAEKASIEIDNLETDKTHKEMQEYDNNEEDITQIYEKEEVLKGAISEQQEAFFSMEEEQGELEMKEDVEIIFPEDMPLEEDVVTEELMDELIDSVQLETIEEAIFVPKQELSNEPIGVIQVETIEESAPVVEQERMDKQVDVEPFEVNEDIVSVGKQVEKRNNLILNDQSQRNETEQVENVDLEDAKNILKRKINWQEAEGVKTKIDYSRLPATAVLNVSEMTSAEIKSLFTIQEIPDEIFKKMRGKSYKADCILPRSELRYLRLLYYGFDDKTHVGDMIVNVSVAEDVRDIFYLLYQEKYPIERMVLVDEYGADDILSMAANNTSGFNYRKIDGMSVLSKHSRGLAIDVNPKYNPYVRTINGEINCQPQNGEPFMDREKTFPYKIDHEDLCYCLFRTYGFSWGGDWKDMKDYQHFQKQC